MADDKVVPIGQSPRLPQRFIGKPLTPELFFEIVRLADAAAFAAIRRAQEKTLDAEAALKTAEAEGVQRAAELADWQARLSQNGRDAQAAFSILRGPVAIGIGVVIAGALMLDQTELLVFVAGLAAFVSGVFVLAHGLHTAGKKIQPAKPVSKVASN